jgi:acyl carrier protein
VLTRTPTTAEIAESIRLAITEILQRNDRPVKSFDKDDLLVAIGLTSLDLAALVAKLERVWNVDPFLEIVAITEMRTVGDLCRAYYDCIQAE